MDETRLQSSSWLNTPISFPGGSSTPTDVPSGIAVKTHVLLHSEWE